VLGQPTDLEVLNDAVRPRVDHIDGVTGRVRYVDERARETGGAAKHSPTVRGVDI